MRGCVSDGLTREEALVMIADAMASYLEEEPGWKPVVFDAEHTGYEKRALLAEYQERGGKFEMHWVQPRFITEEEMRQNPRFGGMFPSVL